MSRKTKSIVLIVAVVVIVVIVIAIIWRNFAGTSPASENQATPSGVASTPSQSLTRAPAPADLTVPDKGSNMATAGVAVPQVQAVANPSGNSSYRSFSITAQNGAFTPNTVIVNQGDDIDLQITAVGSGYDFTQPDYGFHVQLPAGQMAKVDFAATASGKFTFYCSACGGPEKGPIGYIDVVAPH